VKQLLKADVENEKEKDVFRVKDLFFFQFFATFIIFLFFSSP